ncbi:MAG: response regulator [Bacteroidetes bacterium]|nr:response regulator [Bacteroidota bacterium]
MIKVQIIEDYQQDISILENAIKQSGLEIDITVSRSIEEAIEITSKNNFDCIFLDYYFPKQNGSDFLKYYSSKNKSGNIIMVTSQEDVHMAVECMKLGASDFLTKTKLHRPALEKVFGMS